MKDHPFILHKNRTGNLASEVDRGPTGARRARRQVLMLAAALLVGLLLVATTVMGAAHQAAAPQAPANFTVNDPADPGAPACTAGSCSLRAALAAANAASLTATQTIDFDLTYPVTITLASPLPPITGSVVISGPGSANLAISGGDLYRVFAVTSTAYLELHDLAVARGFTPDGAAGIYVDQGTLVLNNCEVAANYSIDMAGGGGILNDSGTVHITDCLIRDNSSGSSTGGALRSNGGQVTIAGTTFDANRGFHNGAIENYGVMTITDSLFRGNRARVTGGIFNQGTMTITNSTFQANIAYIASSGAIFNVGDLVVANSTFYENGADRGADIENSGTAYVTNSTIYSTTSPSMNSVYAGGAGSTLVFSNTIFAAPSGISNCSLVGGGLILVSGDSLATDTTCPGATVVTATQLHLGSLQDNGGSTPTVALLDTSVAIDAGDRVACQAAIGPPDYGAGGLDQRGVTRLWGANCDVGAYEVPHVALLRLPVIRKAP